MLRQHIIKLWGVVWGQCSPALQAEIKGDEGYSSNSSRYDVVWLLSALKLVAAGIDRSVSSFQAIVSSLTQFHTLRQQTHESTEVYRRRFESAWNATIMNKASLGNHPEFVKHSIEHDPTTSTPADVESKLAATYFINFADPMRFSGLWEDLDNATLLGRDEYHSLWHMTC